MKGVLTETFVPHKIARHEQHYNPLFGQRYGLPIYGKTTKQHVATLPMYTAKINILRGFPTL